MLREYSALNPDGLSARVAQTQSAAGVEQCPTPASYHQSCLLPSISVCRATLDCATAFAPVVSLGSSPIPLAQVLSSIAACAAARRASGTRNGEQLT